MIYVVASFVFSGPRSKEYSDYCGYIPWNVEASSGTQHEGLLLCDVEFIVHNKHII